MPDIGWPELIILAIVIAFVVGITLLVLVIAKGASKPSPSQTPPYQWPMGYPPPAGQAPPYQPPMGYPPPGSPQAPPYQPPMGYPPPVGPQTPSAYPQPQTPPGGQAPAPGWAGPSGPSQGSQ